MISDDINCNHSLSFLCALSRHSRFPYLLGKPIPSQQVATLTNAINESLFQGVIFINMNFHFTDFLQGNGAAWCRIRLLFRLAALRGDIATNGYDSLFESVSNPPKHS